METISYKHSECLTAAFLGVQRNQQGVSVQRHISLPSSRAFLISLFLSAAFPASSVLAQTQQPGHRPGFGEILGNLFPLIIMVFFIFYFMVTRPQQQKQKALEDLHAGLKKGDLVLTASGIIGRISGIESDHFVVEIASGVKVKFEKSTVNRKIEKVEQSKSE